MNIAHDLAEIDSPGRNLGVKIRGHGMQVFARFLVHVRNAGVEIGGHGMQVPTRFAVGGAISQDETAPQRAQASQVDLSSRHGFVSPSEAEALGSGTLSGGRRIPLTDQAPSGRRWRKSYTQSL